jgi:hypothetical protein
VEGKTYSTYYQWMLAENTPENVGLIRELHGLQKERDQIKNDIEEISKRIKYPPLPTGREPEPEDDKEEE